VNTLGHHGAELDDAIREQLERDAHSTMLGNGNQIVVELAEALAPKRRPGDRPGGTKPASPGSPLEAPASSPTRIAA
jgi:hypothetical protein